MKTTILASVLALFTAAASAATSFAYQGVLRDANGVKLTGDARSKTITFRLYTLPVSETSTALWARKINVQLDEDGLFNTELSDSVGGAVDGFPATLESVLSQHANSTLFVGLEVYGSSGEIRPRQKILPVPVASFAQDVAHANGDFSVTGIATIQGAVNAQSNVTISARTTTRSLTVEDGATVTGGVTVNGALNLSDEDVGLALAAGTPFTIGGVNAAIPSGVIVMWNGSAASVPAGWALCDGTQGTPDLRSRFILGAGTSSDADLAAQYTAAGIVVAPGSKTGGEVRHTLTVNEMPAHTHSMVMYGADLGAAWDDDNYFYTTFTKYSKNRNTPSTASAGSSQPHNNLPPFYALCFIMKK